MTWSTYPKLSLMILGILLFASAAPAPAQSLGEIARKAREEREAREKRGEVPVKVFTNDDVARMPPITILKSSRQTPSSPETKPPASPQQPGAAVSGTQAGASAAPQGKARSREESKEYWEARFKAACARLAHATEEQTLVEDELRLLQIQQARELNPDRSRKLNGRIDATNVELEAKRAATEKAKQAMEKIEKEFKESGAPQDWIQKDPTADQ